MLPEAVKVESLWAACQKVQEHVDSSTMASTYLNRGAVHSALDHERDAFDDYRTALGYASPSPFQQRRKRRSARPSQSAARRSA